MGYQQTWVEVRTFWRPFLLKYQEDQRLQKYFQKLRQEFPNPPKDWREHAKAKDEWKQILEQDKEQKKNVE